MRIDWPIRLGLVFVIGLMMGGCAGQETASTQAAGVMELKVVKTWRDLMNQPVVQVDGETVRLGIEATHCEAGTGALVYCAPSEQPEMRDVIGPEGEPLGPVYVRVVSAEQPVPLEPPELKRRLAERSYGAPVGREWPGFYTTAARVGEAGAYEVLVQGDDGKVVAKAKIEAVEGKGIPWLTFSAVELTKGPEGNTYDLVAAPATPRWDGGVIREMTEKLPQLSSGVADPGLEVSVADGGLVKVKSARWVDRFMEDHWLIRWWVNGKPVLLKVGKGEKRKRISHKRAMQEKITEPMEFQFRLNVDRKKLGPGPKDRLEFQLMYCSDGVDFGGGIKVMDEMKVKGAIDLRLSKRLRWDR